MTFKTCLCCLQIEMLTSEHYTLKEPYFFCVNILILPVLSKSQHPFCQSELWNHQPSRQKCNLTLAWAHPPISWPLSGSVNRRILWACPYADSCMYLYISDDNLSCFHNLTAVIRGWNHSCTLLFLALSAFSLLQLQVQVGKTTHSIGSGFYDITW